MFDWIIRNACLHDGLGSPAKQADLAVSAGRIARIATAGSLAADDATRSIDADGRTLMPGIVDLHTHYDAQATWDRTLSPSPSLGVTTVVMGNCGFGIAPCPSPMRTTILRNLSVVEGMDLDALEAGTNRSFESFESYLNLLRSISPYANVAVFAQHSTIRSAVMGADAATQSDPTPAQLSAMREEVRGALRAGAIGFASSFSPNHSGWNGQPMPSTIATQAEIEALIDVLGEERRGVFMMATGSRATPEVMASFAARSGRPGFISTVLAMYNDAEPDRARDYYERCTAAIGRGHEIYIQAACQPLQFDFTLRDPYLLYSHDAFDAIKQASNDTVRQAIYRDPRFRAAFRANLAAPKPGILFYGDWERVEVVAEGRASVAAIARNRGTDPLDTFFDLGAERGLDTAFAAKLFQALDEGVEPLLQHPAGVLALSDAGAHLKFLCDAGFGLHFLGHWVRERAAFTWEEGVRRLTSDPARKYRIPERGVIQVGAPADLLLFDPARVGIGALERVADLPAGAERLIRRPRGVEGVWVNGVQVYDGNGYPSLDRGPGIVLDRFDA